MNDREAMKKYFKEEDGEYLMSMAAVLWLTSEAINSPDADVEGKERARRVVDEVIAAGRAARFERADILETMLVGGAPASRLLPLSDELIQRIGLPVFFEALGRAGFSFNTGEGME